LLEQINLELGTQNLEVQKITRDPLNFKFWLQRSELIGGSCERINLELGTQNSEVQKITR